jgi:hypothetical protein
MALTMRFASQSGQLQSPQRSGVVVFWAVAASLVLHTYVLALWWQGSSQARGPSQASVLHMRLLPLASSTQTAPPEPDLSRSHAAVDDTPPRTDVPTATTYLPLDAPAQGVAKDYFYAASELTQNPWIPGEPAFNFSVLGTLAEAINGELELELFIDQFGAVVRTQVVHTSGLDSAVEDLLVKQFARYSYHAGRIGDAPVKSRSHVRIALANGRKMQDSKSTP